MPVEVSCAACQGRFRVPDTAAGKRIKCPKCKSPIDVPAGAVTWTLKTEDGAEYGPVLRAELDAWHQEGRVTAECQVLLTGAPQWQWASDLYPDLAATPAEGSGGFVIHPGDSRRGSSSVITKSAKSSVGAQRTKSVGRHGRSKAITYLAIGSYVVCGIQLLSGLSLAASGSTLGAMMSGSVDRNAQAAAGWFAGFFFVLGLACIALSIPPLLSGYGLMNRTRWGRLATLVSAIVSLPFFPGGSGYAIWALVVLFDKKYADEFH